MLVLVLGGTGYLYGGLIGAVVFKLLQEVFSSITPQYWQFWIGLVLVILVLVGRERMANWSAPLRAFLSRIVPRAGRSVEAARPSPADGP